MRFIRKFSVWKGAGAPANADMFAVAAPPTAAPSASMNRLVTIPTRDQAGWPVHRIAVAYKSPGGATVPKGFLYAYDAETDAWFKLNPTAGTDLTANAITFFDSIIPVDQPATKEKMDGGSLTGRSLSLYLDVTDPGTLNDGEHIFAITGDLTTDGT